ncbi:glycosyltransferase [Collinsella bouchesdurhonensis]|uniref:glycosyltransferase n=1 Tax=Collinsella bouchesdurhonensis TaxID=1907654 RepID=UPI003F8BD043
MYLPTISIVLPTYNGSDFLSESIQSVINQSYKKWELIIIDDCSTDDTPHIAQKYAAEDSRIRYYKNTHNMKLPASLNRGFELAEGKYHTWTSDDNRYKPEALSKMLEAIESNNDLGLVYGDCIQINEKGEATGMLSGVRSPLFLYCCNVIQACFLYKGSIFKEIGGYSTDLFLVEDYDFWLRIARSYKIKHINRPLYEYRVHGKSLTATRQIQIRQKADYILRRELDNQVQPIVKPLLRMGIFYNKAKLNSSIRNNADA